MSLTATTELLLATTDKGLEGYRKQAKGFNQSREFGLDVSKLNEPALLDLRRCADAIQDAKTSKALGSILAAREGQFGTPVANFKAFEDVLRSYLGSNILDGWVYVEHPDGKLYPQLIVDITFDDGNGYRRKGTPSVTLRTVFIGSTTDGNNRFTYGGAYQSHVFQPSDVARKRVGDALALQGIYKETSELKQAHEASLASFQEHVVNGFAQQYRIHGPAYRYEEDDYERRGRMLRTRAIHDMDADAITAYVSHVDSEFFLELGHAEGVGEVPMHPVVRLFDLATHEFVWVHGDHLSVYEYDLSLKDKLVLPASHRDLLDVLTSNLDAFVTDFVEGKSAGNVILCKGIPGVGKTLTAEVYAELIKRPLYSIHSGTLGTSSGVIQENLTRIFQQADRWGCVLLLDEADVFVVQRGADIEQNAIVAEFLRTLEYFRGLMFMTTNRPSDIDEAIVSRCAAIIDYQPPCPVDARKIWKVMATQFQAEISDALLDELLALFPDIAPRDIKMLLRLVLRVAEKEAKALDVEMFRRCAMFRAVKMATAPQDGLHQANEQSSGPGVPSPATARMPITTEDRVALRRAAEDAIRHANPRLASFVEQASRPLNILALLDMAEGKR